MRISPISRRFISIPSFGLFSLIVVFSFSLAFLSFLQPEIWKDLLPTEAGGLNGPQVIFFLSLSAGIAAAGSGMLFWGLLIVLPWKWLQTKSWGITALLGSLIGLIEIISTAFLMWIVYIFFLLVITRPSSDILYHLLVLLPLGSVGLGMFTVVLVGFGSKWIVFLGGIAAGMFFALLARRIFS